MEKVKSKRKVTKRTTANNKEAKQIANELRDLKKSFKSQLNQLKLEFNKKLKLATANAFEKAVIDFEREMTKRSQAKAKLLREANNNFEKKFPSKFAHLNTTKKAKKTNKPKKASTRTAKNA